MDPTSPTARFAAPSGLAELGEAPEPLTPQACAERARAAAALLSVDGLTPAGDGEAVLLWRTASSEAWLNLWWAPRDTGYHDHDGSCVGVHVIRGVARNEGLTVDGQRRVREHHAGESFHLPNAGIHRMEHDPGAITVHVYSPPIRSLGHYEVVDGLLQRSPGGPEDPSPASPELLAALERRGTQVHDGVQLMHDAPPGHTG